MSDGRRNLPWLILSAFECLYTRFRGRERPEDAILLRNLEKNGDLFRSKRRTFQMVFTITG